MEDMDPVAQEIMAALDCVLHQEKCAGLQASALEERQYALTETFRMVQDMKSESAIEEVLTRFGFVYHGLDDDADLWISDEHGLMVFLAFTAADGQYYNYRIVAFDVLGEDVEEEA